MAQFEDYLARKQKEYGNKFDDSSLDRRLIPYFNNGQRIKITTGDMTVTGRIGVTTGWKPVFLLMRRSNATGSSWTLEPGIFEIVGIKIKGKYEGTN